MRLTFWLWVIVVLTALTVFVLVPLHGSRVHRAMHSPPEEGCEYIGQPRGFYDVFFYDCNGEIKMKRVK